MPPSSPRLGGFTSHRNRHSLVQMSQQHSQSSSQQQHSSPSSARYVNALARTSTYQDDFVAPPGSPVQRILSPSLRIHVLPDKLSQDDIDTLRNSIVTLGALNSGLPFANVVISETKAPKRAERALGAEAASRGVPVIHQSWLNACLDQGIQVPYDDYLVFAPAGFAKPPPIPPAPVVLKRSSDAVEPESSRVVPIKKPRPMPASVVKPPPPPRADKDGDSSHTEEESVTEDEASDAEGADSQLSQMSKEGNSPVRRKSTSPSKGKARAITPEAEADVPDFVVDYKGRIPPWLNHQYAIFRPSPLKSVHNQALVDELEVIRVARTLSEGGKSGDKFNASAYARALSAIKAYPRSLKANPKEAKDLIGVGAKIYKCVVQFYELGYIAEAKTIRADKSHAIMRTFLDFYGVGPARAREAYQRGARTLEELCAGGSGFADKIGRQECLRILPDLKHKIPRAEVEEIASMIHKTYEETTKQAMDYTICGGYRRGKAMSSDVDIVLTRKLAPGESGASLHGKNQTKALNDVLEELKKKTYMSHRVSVSHPEAKYDETPLPHVDIAEIVVFPRTSSAVPVARHRRVDIVICRPEVYGAAILGWTGSRQFEKDIRRHAQDQGYKFHSTGLVEKSKPSVAIPTPREEDIFKILGVDYMPPHMRNCDA